MQFYRVVNKTYMTGIVIDILGQGIRRHLGAGV